MRPPEPVVAAAPKPRRRTVSGNKPGGGKGPSGAQESNAQFENLHARAENGVFTAGPDANHGPKADEPSVGSKGPKVSGLQGLLNDLGYTDANGDKLKTDGNMGPVTVAALARAQANLGIEGEDGFLGPKTRAALREELAAITPTKKPKAPARRRAAPKKPKAPAGSAAATGTGKTPTRGVVNGRDTHDMGDTYRDQGPGRGKWGTPWPPEWGKEPPAEHGDARRIRGYSDGSARYEDGTVYDPDTGKFRKFGEDDGTVRKGPGNTSRRSRSRSRARTKPSSRASSKPTDAENESALERLYRLYNVKGHTMTLERKALHGGGTKVINADEGIVEAIISVTGIVDEVKDVILPGAYAKTLATRKPKGVAHHAWDTPVSRCLDVKELMPGDPGLPKTTAKGDPWPRQAGAVIVTAQFNLETQRGMEAFSDVKFYGDEQEWSIGYDVPRGGARIDHKTGQRHIQTLALFEFSPVLFGAMPLAGSLASKSLYAATLDIEEKTLAGSYEAVREAIEEAARPLLLEQGEGDEGPFDGGYKGWISVRATFPDHAVICAYTRGESQDYEVPYTMAGDVAVLGTPVKVKVTEVVEPDHDADAEPASEYPTEVKDDGVLSTAEILATENLRQYV